MCFYQEQSTTDCIEVKLVRGSPVWEKVGAGRHAGALLLLPAVNSSAIYWSGTPASQFDLVRIVTGLLQLIVTKRGMVAELRTGVKFISGSVTRVGERSW